MKKSLKATLLDNVDHTIIHEICRIISKESDFEVRPPSHAEWQRAEELYGLDLPCGFTEVLSDFPHANYRGAPLMDDLELQMKVGLLNISKVLLHVIPKNNLRIKSHVKR